MSKPLVSIILPTYSRYEGGYLHNTIRSVIAQTFIDWELLIVDDGSIDGSEKLIKQFCKEDQRIKHIRLPANNGFPAYTTSLAYLQSKGDYIAFAFDDCVLYPNHILYLLDAALRNPSAGFVYGQCRMVGAGTNKDVLGSPFDMHELITKANFVPNVSVMLPRAVVDVVGWYDPHVILKRSCDWDLWIRIGRKYPVVYLPQVLAEEHGMSLSGSLGNALSLNLPLIYKYIQQPRDHLLHPTRLQQYDSFRLDFSDHLSWEEVRNVSQLQLEHLIRTSDVEGLIRFAADHRDDSPEHMKRWEKIKLQNKKTSDYKQLLLTQACLQYIDVKNDFNFEDKKKLLDLIAEKDNYISEQFAYIEEQWRLIREKDEHIAALQSMLR